MSSIRAVGASAVAWSICCLASSVLPCCISVFVGVVLSHLLICCSTMLNMESFSSERFSKMSGWAFAVSPVLVLSSTSPSSPVER